MKKNKSYNVRSVLFRVVVFQAIILFLLFCFGCKDETTKQEDLPIGEITVYNLPENIQVYNSATNKYTDTTNDAFKIYFYVSDEQSESAPSVAKGLAKLSEKGKLENGKWSVTITLQKPNTPEEKDPNKNTGSWSGTANYFSVIICPKNTATDKQDAIYMRGGFTLDKSKEDCDWENLIDLRKMKDDTYFDKIKAFYDDVIVNDSDITTE